MDQVIDTRARRNDRMERIVAALRGGLILVDAQGGVAWIDDKTRRRMNGGLQGLALPKRRTSGSVLDCSMWPVEVTIHGQRTVVCAIQESVEPKDWERDLVATIQTVMADTSWFTRTVIEKVKSLRYGNRSGEEPSDGVDTLSGREREVLGLICEGVNDIEMSRMLRLSPNTVRNHIASLYRKIGVNRRGAAIIWARERGITGPDLVARKRRRARSDDGTSRPAK